MLKISQPVTAEEFAEYYDLRWRILRAPWDQPRGSEQDEWEDTASHITVRDQSGRLLGIGRLHINGSDEAWIRYMATTEDSRGLGIGTAAYRALEEIAIEAGLQYISLNARENAVAFYQKHDFVIIAEGPTMFGTIRHKLMQKRLSR